MTRSSKPSDKVDLSDLNSISSNVVKIAQSFAFGRKRPFSVLETLTCYRPYSPFTTVESKKYMGSARF